MPTSRTCPPPSPPQEYFEEASKVYRGTELLLGGELLDAVLLRGSSYNEADVRACFRKVLEGIAYMHEMQVPPISPIPPLPGIVPTCVYFFFLHAVPASSLSRGPTFVSTPPECPGWAFRWRQGAESMQEHAGHAEKLWPASGA